ncbi:MAG: tRNA (adenosine(37)-N6)-threonylcarbamoyltransferase complex transferase subunit TsaD [Filifactoraceae bacterium]
MKDVLVLGIETSCDETSAAVIKNGREVLSNIVATQIDIHKKFGGVVPEVASRNHVLDINKVIKSAIEEANVQLKDIDSIAVTYGPGLVGALLVGLSTGKALALALDIPLIGVNHIEGHIAANYISHKNLEPPFISLIVSGGHSHIVSVKNYNEFEIMGRTQDDAVGEAYDKVARVLGLGYPGGPLIDKLAKEGRELYDYPKAFYKEDNYNFSFSGLKSSVLNHINSLKMKNEDINKADIAASFQKAAVDILCNKAIKAVEDSELDKLVLCGGVSANSMLRKVIGEVCVSRGIKLYYPPIELCTDNAAMIGSAGYFEYLSENFSDFSLNAVPNLKIGQR